MRRFLFLFLIIKNSFGTVAGDFTLLQIATNTLSSVRNLNEILTDQREFSENFEKIYGSINDAVWRADRVEIWLNDMKELSESDIENLDDFNYILATLKSEKHAVKASLAEAYNAYQKSLNTEKKASINKKKSLARGGKFTQEINQNSSLKEAQIQTAHNTKDLLIESTRQSSKLDQLTAEIARLNTIISSREAKKSIKEYENESRMNQLKKGVLSNKVFSK